MQETINEREAAAFMANPDWAQIIAPYRPPSVTRHLPTHEDCSLLDVRSAQEHLRVGGSLGRMNGYEERPGQIEMCGAIVRAFNEREHLMVEAGTGVGKSLAYLVPSVLWSWTNDTPVVVSTATRNLQGQLIRSDIPRAVSILGDNASKFKMALLKGRSNYLCLKSVDEYFSAGFWTLPEDEQRLMPGLVDFLRHTEDGDLDYYEGIDRVHLSRPGDECSGRRCPFFSRCFVYRARARAAEAHLIIVNHSLVMAEASASTAGILPAYGRMVFDEAHNLEAIATEQFSSEFSQAEVGRAIRRLVRHHPAYARIAAEISRAADEFLSFLGRLLPKKREVIRYSATKYYWDDVSRLLALQQEFERPVISLVNLMKDAANVTQDADESLKLLADANRILAIANSAAFVVKGERDDMAYWVERYKNEGKKMMVRLVAAPLSVASLLKGLFYEVKDSVVLSSATLRIGNDFRYMAKRLGCFERFTMITASSPFDYLKQALVLAPDCLPDPSSDPGAYAVELGWMLKDLFDITNGRGLVLFTSYEMMNSVADCARQLFSDVGIKLLVQGEGNHTREGLTQMLKTEFRTVLFGAQSFWEGVDIAGEALSCVVLARLPFAQVGDPVVEARSEKIEREGGSPFRDYMLPEAVIRFRQGFGRLIRSKKDRGVVIVTDSRIVTKNYGSIFRKAIPSSVHTVSDSAQLMDRVREWMLGVDGV